MAPIPRWQRKEPPEAKEEVEVVGKNKAAKRTGPAAQLGQIDPRGKKKQQFDQEESLAVRRRHSGRFGGLYRLRSCTDTVLVGLLL